MFIDQKNKFSELAIASNFLFWIYNTNGVIKISNVIYIIDCFGVQHSAIEFSILFLSNANRVIRVSNIIDLDFSFKVQSFTNGFSILLFGFGF